MNELRQHLERISAHTNSRLVIQCGVAWVVIHSFAPANRILVEISSNTYLPDEHRLTEHQLEQLQEWGYKVRRQGRSLGMMTYLAAEDDFLKMERDIKRIFTEVFTVPAAYAFSFQENVKIDLQNNDLLNVMRNLGRDKKHENRISLYQELVNATLLVYVSEDLRSFQQYDTIGPFSTFAAFTDDKNHRQFDPRGCPVQLRHCYEFIPELVEQNAGSLIINPRGDVRGELYRNELQTIASALRRHRS
jgi:hypothetical protein